MGKPNRDVRLHHMPDHAREAVVLSKGKTRSDMDSDRLLNLALVRLLEIVGEAATRVPKEERALHPDIPCSQIVSVRNRLIYEYDAVDNDILWQIIIGDLPPLVASMEVILARKDVD